MTYTTFDGNNRTASGSLTTAAISAWERSQDPLGGPILVFDDRTGRVVDLDLRGTLADVAARTQQATQTSEKPETTAKKRGRGRPKLGVKAKEVTLLPKHWAWLQQQPRSVSATLRLLVEEKMRQPDPAASTRQATNRAYAFMTAMAGDLPGFEEVSRALFAGDDERLTKQLQKWPVDVRLYVEKLRAM